MSSCLILQDKHNFYIGADTACSNNINGKYYRVADNIKKIFQCGNDVFFCSGNLSVVQNVVSWIYNNYSEVNEIDVNKLSCYLRANYLKQVFDVFDVEVVVCRNGCGSHIYQISQYNNFNVVYHKPHDSGVNILCCGYKTSDIYSITRQTLLSGCTDINSIYRKVFNSIYDNKVGGNLILYKNTNIVLCEKIYEVGIEYSDINHDSLHLLIAEAVLSGYIESSAIIGGTINIGNGAFVVHEDGTVTMNAAGNTIDGYAKEEYVDEKIEGLEAQIEDITGGQMYRIEIMVDGPTVISTADDQATLKCKVYSWDSDITNDLDDSLFNWRRTSTDDAQDEIWNAMPEHQGVKLITINADDIIENSSFVCAVNLPE